VFLVLCKSAKGTKILLCENQEQAIAEFLRLSKKQECKLFSLIAYSHFVEGDTHPHIMVRDTNPFERSNN